MTLFILMLLFIGIAAAVAWFLIAHDHGEKEPIGALWLAAGFGLLGGVAAGIIESAVLPSQNLLPGTPVAALLVTTLAIGVIEEACKFLPLALLLYPKRYFNEHSDGVIYFALAGLGFGLPENILYSIQYGNKAGMARIVLTPFFHAATTGVVGYYLAKGKLAGKSPWLAIVPLGAMMILHGLYDFGLSSSSGLFAALSVLLTLLLSAGLFAVFFRASERDQDRGLSAVGHNAFCRSCGFPNPQHHLYCTNCGKNA